ncbi:MAG: glycosyltransferase [Actinomycetes bacterium]
MSAPQNVIELGAARAAARAARDFSLADKIRDQIADLGYEILDLPDGFDFRAKARFPVVARITDVKALTETQFDAVFVMVVDSFAADARLSLQNIKKNAVGNFAIQVLISGTPDTEPLLAELDGQTFLVQVTEGAGWGESINALIKIATAPIVIVMDPSTQLTGDALTPVIDALNKKEFSAVGWRGGLVNLVDDWRTTEDKGPGEVDVLFSYFMALDRAETLEAGAFNIRARYYRNADIEFSLRLRQAHGRLLQMELPLIQARHHGYYDADPEFRETESKKNYDRILDRFRGKNEILSPRR